VTRATALARISRELRRELDGVSFSPPVQYVYNPLVYAAEPHRRYLERYADCGATVLFVGMNPGPWGMAQTGVPFGTVSLVRDWLGIDGRVGRPEREHPKRPVEGFACARDEVSGARLWGWALERFGTPERFFARLFVGNYCPLLFLDAGGRNLTPDKLRASERAALALPCDRALARVVETMDVELVVGIGAFARRRAELALDGAGVRVGQILHPSPASPIANRGWAERAERELAALGVVLG
jgi:single-strand selective monofunctional uracil DNA glycosylase